MQEMILGSARFNAVDKKNSELVISPKLKLFKGKDVEVDVVTYEVIRHRLWQINMEQGSTIRRVSGSTVASTCNDFNVAVTDEFGDVVCLAPFILWHGSVLDLIIKWILENDSEGPGINDGDMFLCNDPWVGAIHQNDAAILKPIFYKGKLFCWVASTVHLLDVGGGTPGSFCVDAKDIFDEPTPIPPIKIMEDGQIRKDVEDMLVRHSRIPPMVSLDLRAQIASNNIAEERIKLLIKRYGADVVKAAMKKIMDETEHSLRDRLRKLPDGNWRHTDFIDIAKSGDRGVYKGVCTMSKRGDTLHFDFDGTDAQVVGLINCTYSGLKAGIYSALLPLLCPDMSWAPGALNRVISISAPAGTLVNAMFPGTVSMAAISACFLATNCANMCVAKMFSADPEESKHLVTISGGAWPGFNLMGIDQRGMPYIQALLDAMMIGSGARSWRDGDDTGGALFIPSGLVANVEDLEWMAPMLMLYRREEQDSGGAGRFRGGNGMTECWIPHDTEVISGPDIGYGLVVPTGQGIAGGYPAKGTSFKAVRNSDIQKWFEKSELPGDIEDVGSPEILPYKIWTIQAVNDIFRLSAPGGGGYGDPLKRDPQMVREDVINSAVSFKAANDIYGVIVDKETLEIDISATHKRREEMRNSRLEAAIGGKEK